MVQDMLHKARELSGPSPKAIISPHAGYIYSGPIAASAFVQFARDQQVIRRVVLAGPSHYVPFHGIALSQAYSFSTPLGEVLLDQAAGESLARQGLVEIREDAHREEHSLEVQLPFLQEVLPGCSIIPLVIGEASPEEVGACLEALWGGQETRIIISSDLSHYLDYETAKSIDYATACKIERLAADELDSADACGCAPVRGLLFAARNHALKCTTIDLRNSGDTAGPRQRVVGYGAFMFTTPASEISRS